MPMPDLPKNIDLEPLPFDEAIAFFADKVPLSVDEFYALARAMRARAFTVARVMSMDVITDIRDALLSAIEAGETLADFRAGLSETMSARGWEGLTPWHAETVFRNNIQTSYSVGRWNQMKDSADRFYGEYDAVNDSHTRPTHAAMDGKIYPMDHPFWDTWWPPNGHRCRCGVNPVHKYVVEEEGLKVETDDPTNMLIEPKDPVSGKKMPARPLVPDPGWDTHPGKTPWDPDLSRYPAELRKKFEEES
jgi:SPP1 gp7 family putative phage head morphogenesis protein